MLRNLKNENIEESAPVKLIVVSKRILLSLWLSLWNLPSITFLGTMFSWNCSSAQIESIYATRNSDQAHPNVVTSRFCSMMKYRKTFFLPRYHRGIAVLLMTSLHDVILKFSRKTLIPISKFYFTAHPAQSYTVIERLCFWSSKGSQSLAYLPHS